MARSVSGPIDSRSAFLRCAIYTRKSTEEGLDQAFNSLDAQREACAAYIQSQRHEGWTLAPALYDDGGYSGGNMDRPGLVRLLADVRSGKVDVIVVYKVDRLTRSLSDFAKIVDVLDEANASFVSITQAFNTTTSMGRLTLNVLLSFAQFEREVISERVRDKIAASKAKGMWMGGPVPLGYDVKDRKLLINEGEAEVVRRIYQRYVELGSVRPLIAALTADGVRTKVQIWSNGRQRGGIPFARGALYQLLQNRVYLGQTTHKGAFYPGQHDGIIPQPLWDAVQEQLRANRVIRSSGRNHQHISLLAGMITDTAQGPLANDHACKAGRRYRYYMSKPSEGGSSVRLPAADLERVAVTSIANTLSDLGALVGQIASLVPGRQLDGVITRWAHEAQRMATMVPSDLRELLNGLDLRIRIDGDQIDASIALDRLIGSEPTNNDGPRLAVPVPALVSRRGHEQRLIYLPKEGAPARLDSTLVDLVVRAHATRRGLVEGSLDASLDSQARRHLMRLARLSYLAPDIVEAILAGAQPSRLTARRLLREPNIPMAWAEQRRLFGFA